MKLLVEDYSQNKLQYYFLLKNCEELLRCYKLLMLLVLNNQAQFSGEAVFCDQGQTC